MAVKFLGVRTGGMGSSAALVPDAAAGPDAADDPGAAPAPASDCSLPVEQLASTAANGSITKTARIRSLLPRAQVFTARSLPCSLHKPTGDGQGSSLAIASTIPVTTA
jgi:hypothetical protein